MIPISVDDLIALQRYTIYNNERLNYVVFWFNYGRKAQKTTKMVLLLQMCAVVITGMRIGAIPAILVILMLIFALKVEKKVEIG